MDLGRVSFVARGARSPRSGLKSMLQLFTPLKVKLRGAGRGLKTLAECEPAGRQITYLPPTLFSALYVNELVYRLYKTEDPCAGLFSAYAETLNMMLDERKVEQALRGFELSLMDELGCGVDFYHEADGGDPVAPRTWYYYRMRRGFVPVSPEIISSCISVEDVYKGADLLRIPERRFTPSALRAAKRICRKNIDYLLNGREIMSRKLYAEYMESAGGERPEAAGKKTGA